MPNMAVMGTDSSAPEIAGGDPLQILSYCKSPAISGYRGGTV